MPDLCTAVTERGSCEQCSRAYTHHVERWGKSARAASMPLEIHKWLGPVLARCGHEEGEHYAEEDGSAPFCDKCLGPRSLSNAGTARHEFTDGD